MLHLGVAHSLIHKNNTHEIYSTLQCFDNMIHVIYAHEWMNDAHVHEMQVQLGKPNTRGVTGRPRPIDMRRRPRRPSRPYQRGHDKMRRRPPELGGSGMSCFRGTP